MTAPVVVLGATGSIGRQALAVATELEVPVLGLAARRPSNALLEIARSEPDAAVAVAGGSSDERDQFVRALGRGVAFGSEAVVEMAVTAGATIINGIVGAAGLTATVAALEAGNRVGLANKESLVAGGPVVLAALASGGGELIPVDSEHSAIYQCLLGEQTRSVNRLILTASGGPFRGKTSEDLAAVTPSQALAHPTWDMGPRITIDSATLFNKGLEVIEAHFLFGLGYDRIDVVVHPQSIVHSAVEFADRSVKAHLGLPDMRIPIQYAMTAPDRLPNTGFDDFDLFDASLEFFPPDRATFRSLDICYQAGREGGSAPAVVNAADEVAVEAFLAGRLGFNGITEVVARTLDGVDISAIGSVADVVEADREARGYAAGLISGAC